MSQARRWCFTINNPTIEHERRLQSLECVYLVWGRERAPTTGTRHLQGFVIFGTPYRRRRVVELIGPGHYEPTRAPSEAAAQYCKKDGDFEERGTFPSRSGRRSDLLSTLDWLDEFIADNQRAPTEREVAILHPQALLRYPRTFMSIAQHRAPPPVLRRGDLRGWQTELETALLGEADDRTILFYIDPEGGKGKTYFQQYMVSHHHEKVQVLGVGKRDDLAYSVDPSKSIFLFNVPRGGMEYLQYTILEQLKDRMVFSTKYQSQMKILRHTPHVVVFSNEQPDLDAMSRDRFTCIDI